MSIGDNINDKENARKCRNGNSNGNSAPYIKEMAKDVTLDNNANGVAEALKIFYLIDEFKKLYIYKLHRGY